MSTKDQMHSLINAALDAERKWKGNPCNQTIDAASKATGELQNAITAIIEEGDALKKAERVPLTDEKIRSIVHYQGALRFTDPERLRNFARAIEAAHGITQPDPTTEIEPGFEGSAWPFPKVKR